MKVINTKIHGALDYFAGSLLLISPWLFGFSSNDAAMSVSVVAAVLLIVMSMFTDYEMGLMRMVSVRRHLMIDLATGISLLVSPWLLGFSDEIYLPHLITGLALAGGAIITDKIPYKISAAPSANN